LGVVALLLALVAPGAAVAAWGPRATLAARCGLVLALSPLVGGAAVAALAVCGVPWAGAFWAVVLGSALLAVLGRWRGRATAQEHAATPAGAGPRAAWIAGIVGVVVLGFGYATSEWWRIASDAWTHEPIVRALLVHGAPPLDPWYAGFRLQYAWLYHAWVASAVASTGVDPFTWMSVLAVVSFAAFALAGGDLLARLHGPRAGGALAFFLLGLNGALCLTALAVAVQAMVGRTAGPEVMARAFAGVGTNADRTADLLRWFGTQTWFGNKFAGATPLSTGLAGLVAWLAALERRLVTPRGERGSALLVMVTAGATALTHPVLLLYLGATSVLMLALVAPGSPARRGETLPLAWHAAWPGLLGLVPAAMYFAGILAPSATHLGAPLDLSWPRVLGLVLCTLPALAFGAPVVRRWWNGAPAERVWAALTLGALAFTLVLRLPGAWPFFTVDKTSYLLWIPWALAGAGAWAAWTHRAPRAVGVAAIVLVLLPATALSLSSRALDPRAALRQPWNDPGMAALRDGLPREALLVVPPGDIDTPVFLARDAFDEDKTDGIVRGYDPDELATRHALVDTLYRAGRLEPALVTRLFATRRPIYVVWPDQGLAWAARTPGAELRRFVALGAVPAWAGVLPPRVNYAGFGAVASFGGAPTPPPGPPGAR
jgi:hypothetical protein